MYTEADRQAFEQYMKGKLAMVKGEIEAEEGGSMKEIEEIFLSIYSNSLTCK